MGPAVALSAAAGASPSVAAAAGVAAVSVVSAVSAVALAGTVPVSGPVPRSTAGASAATVPSSVPVSRAGTGPCSAAARATGRTAATAATAAVGSSAATSHGSSTSGRRRNRNGRGGRRRRRRGRGRGRCHRGGVGVGGVVGVVVDGVPVVGTGKPVPTTVSVAVGVEVPPRGGMHSLRRGRLPRVSTRSRSRPVTCRWTGCRFQAPHCPRTQPDRYSLDWEPWSSVSIRTPGRPDRSSGRRAPTARTGPAPKLTPATTDKAAAAAAPDAMKRLRPKYNLDAVIGPGRTGLGGGSGSGCPNERDVNTSSKVA